MLLHRRWSRQAWRAQVISLLVSIDAAPAGGVAGTGYEGQLSGQGDGGQPGAGAAVHWVLSCGAGLEELRFQQRRCVRRAGPCEDEGARGDVLNGSVWLRFVFKKVDY